MVVGRDLAHYAHVHPARDADGQWVVEVPPMPPGSYRVFADFTPTGRPASRSGPTSPCPATTPRAPAAPVVDARSSMATR